MKSVGNENKKKRNRVIIGSAVGVSLAFGGYAVFDAMSPRDKAEDTTEVIVVETSEEMMTTGELAQALASSETTAVEVTEATTEEIEDEMTTEVESTERADEEDEDDTENVGNTGNSGNSSNGSTGNLGNSGNGGSSTGNGSGSTGNSDSSGNGSTGNGGNAGSGSTENTGNGGSSTTTTESTTTETTESDEPSYGDLIWVVDQEGCWVEVPVYETVYKDICNNCGADVTDNPAAHSTPELIQAGCGAYHLESFLVQTGTELVWQEEQGHWECEGWN